MPEQQTWALQSKYEIGGKPGPWFWTHDSDYTRSVLAAHTFGDELQARRWLNLNPHLKPSLTVVAVDLPTKGAGHG